MHPDETGQTTFFANFLFLNGKLWKTYTFSGSLFERFLKPGAEHDGIFTCMRNQIFKVGQNDVTLSGLAAEHLFQNGGCPHWILGFFGEFFRIACTLEAETSVSNSTQYKLFIGDDEKNRFLEWPSPLTLTLQCKNKNRAPKHINSLKIMVD